MKLRKKQFKESEKALPNTAETEVAKLPYAGFVVGRTVAQFEVKRVYRKGFLSCLYQFKDTKTDAEHVVSLIHPSAVEDSYFWLRCRQLMNLLNEQIIPGLCGIERLDVVDGHPCIFWKTTGDARSLKDRVLALQSNSGFKMDSATTAKILLGVAETIRSANRLGLEHGYLGPNVMFPTSDTSVEVVGFGIRRVIGADLMKKIMADPLLDELNSDLRNYSYDNKNLSDAGSADEEVDFRSLSPLAYFMLMGRETLPTATGFAFPTQYFPTYWRRFFENIMGGEGRVVSFHSALKQLLIISGEGKTPSLYFRILVNFLIQRIPIPMRVMNRGRVAAEFYRWSMISVFLVAVVLFSVPAVKTFRSHLVPTMQQFESADGANATIQVGRSYGPIELISLNTGDVFQLDSGANYFAIKPGTYDFQVRSPNILPFKQSVRITDSELASIPMNLVGLDSGIYLATESSAVVSLVRRDGADSIFLGETDADGHLMLAKETLENIEYLKITKNGFEPLLLEPSAIQFGENVYAEFSMVRTPVMVNFVSDRSGFEVYAEGELVGVTPFSAEFTSGHYYQFEAVAEGYRSRLIGLDVVLGEEPVVDFGQLRLIGAGDVRVQLAAASVRMLQFQQNELSLRVNDEVYKLEDYRAFNVPAGEHSVTLLTKDFESETRQVELLEDTENVLKFSLKPKPTRIQLSGLEGYEAQFLIDGVLQSELPTELVLEPEETKQLRVVIRDHYTMSRQFTGSVNKKILWKIQPRPLPGPQVNKAWTVPYLNMSFSWIPVKPTVTIGTPRSQKGRLPNEPVAAELGGTYGYWMGTFEVTAKEFFSLASRLEKASQAPMEPIHSVSWNEAQNFCARLNEAERKAGRLPEGYAYRLPTENEWEYAASGGSRSAYFFGDEPSIDFGNFNFLTNERKALSGGTYRDGVHTVGKYSPNRFGLHDTIGNVAEWTVEAYKARRTLRSFADYNRGFYDESAVIRGGSWREGPKEVRTASRRSLSRGIRSDSVGFRVVLAPVLKESN